MKFGWCGQSCFLIGMQEVVVLRGDHAMEGVLSMADKDGVTSVYVSYVLRCYCGLAFAAQVTFK